MSQLRQLANVELHPSAWDIIDPSQILDLICIINDENEKPFRRTTFLRSSIFDIIRDLNIFAI